MNTIAFFVGGGIVAPHIIEDCALAVRECGLQSVLVSLQSTDEELARKFADTTPDLLVSLDAKGLDRPVIRSSGIQCVAWFVDNPFYFKELKGLDPAGDIVCIWDAAYHEDLEKEGFERVVHLPLATNPVRFHDAPLSAAEKETFEMPLSFVGTVGKHPAVFSQERKERYLPEVNRLVEKMRTCVVDTFDRKTAAAAQEVMYRTYRTFDRPLRTVIELLLDCEINAYKRWQLLDVLTHFGGTLYGGIDGADGTYANLKKYPSLNYLHDARKVYQGSFISLNATRPQLRSALNQRFFDVFSCGGFLLTDYRQDIETLAQDYAAEICFGSNDELIEKIVFYRGHTARRTAIGEAIKQEVRLRHTYPCRMEYLIAVARRTVKI